MPFVALPLLCSLGALFAMNPISPKSYVCLRATEPVQLDGRLDKSVWKDAPWTDDFQDIEGSAKPTPRFRTRAKMLWDDHFLYVGAELEEPGIWATLTERDSIIYRDNDFEIFLDPDDDGQLYAEIELNALNTIWDLLLVKPYRAGGPYLTNWDIPHMRSAVHREGPINDPRHPSKMWSVEFAIPWGPLGAISNVPSPPRDGDQWRINFSRVEWHLQTVDGKYQKVPNTPEDNWVWSPQGVVDMHRPERWGVVQFSTASVGPVAALPHPGMAERLGLTAAWDAQYEFRRLHGRWASSLTELGWKDQGYEMTATPTTFEISFGPYRINTEQRFWKVN